MDNVKCIIKKYEEEIKKLGRELFNHPELGFFEEQTMEIMSEFLKQHGIVHQKGLAQTGILATLGEGDYHVAIVCDMDALPVRIKDKIVPFHSCGHSIQCAIGCFVLVVLNECGYFDLSKGRVSLIATPAEEFTDLENREQLICNGLIQYASGKQNLIAQGIFDDIDCVLSAHIMGVDEKNPTACFDINSTLAGFLTKKVTFTGKAAHSGAQPHLGINALHAANLAMQALSFVKESFDPNDGIRIYPILKEGGSNINTICDRAILETYIRANSIEAVNQCITRFDEIMNHCSAIMHTQVEIETHTGYYPLSQSKALNEIVHEKMLEICDESQIIKDVVSGASGDIGDLSAFLPTIQFGFSGFEGRIHSDYFKIVDETHVYCDTTYVLVKTILELLNHEEKQVKNAQCVIDREHYLKSWLNN